MLPFGHAVRVCWFAIAALGASGLCAQNYPSRPLRIVTSEAGGGNDIVTRIVTPGLRAGLGQQIVVENRPAGVIPGEVVSRAQPDGHTLLLYGGSFWIAPFFQDVPYDPVKDFVPIALVASTPNVLVVNPGVPANTAKELIALARAKPGALNYASASTGSPNHLAAELFKSMAGIDLVRVPYRGTAPALNDVMAGQVQVMFAIAAASMPHVKSGRLKALAVSSAQPSALAPGVPTIAAAALPGYDLVALYGVFAPAGTPAAIIQRLNLEIVQVLSKSEVKERMFGAGLETLGSSPEAFAAKIRAERATLGELIQKARLRNP